MSAMTGIWDLPAMIGSAAASSAVGQATRTISQPEAVSSAICCRVALMSVVGVVVIDCTLTGDSDPTPTLPTLICRVCRRGASTGGGDAGIPRLTDVTKTIPSVGLVTSHDDRAVAEAGPSCGRIVRTMSIVGPPPASEVRSAAVDCARVVWRCPEICEKERTRERRRIPRHRGYGRLPGRGGERAVCPGRIPGLGNLSPRRPYSFRQRRRSVPDRVDDEVLHRRGHRSPRRG